MDDKDLLQKYIDIAGVILVAIDADHNVSFINRRGIDILKYSKEEIIGKNWFDNFLPERERERVKAGFEKLMAGDKSVEYFENPVLTKNGEERIISWHNAVLSDDNSNFIGTLSSGEDITERKRAENLLSKSRAKLEFLLLHAPCLIYTSKVRDDWEATFVSDNVRTILGYEPDEFMKTQGFWIDHIHPEDKNRVLESLPTLFKSDYYSHEYRFLHKNGTYRWFYDELKLVRDEEGNPVECLGYMIDITDRKQAEEELTIYREHLESLVEERTLELNSTYAGLAESETRFKDISEHTQSWIWEVDASGKYTYSGPVVEKILGYRPEEVIGKYFYDFFHPDNKEETKKTAFDYFSEKKPFSVFINRNVNKKGRTVWLSTSGIPLIDKDGNLTGYRGADIDITEKRQAESELTWKNSLLQILHNVQFNFIADEDPSVIFDSLLNGFLEITGSEYGFVGELFAGPVGKPFLKTHAITNISWNEETRILYEEMKQTGMEFHNLDTLYGSVITSGRHVVSNDPAADPRSKGVPEGHPPLNSFLGLPFYRGDKMIGMVGLANRENGYSEELVSSLQPLLVSYSNIIEAYRVEQQKKKSEQDLLDSEEKYRLIIDNINEIIYKVQGNPLKGNVEFVGIRVKNNLGIHLMISFRTLSYG